MIAKYARLSEDAEHNTSSIVVRSPPNKAFDIMPDAKKVRVHSSDPNKASPIESETPIVYAEFYIKIRLISQKLRVS
jgi:hypothetical protein